MRSGIFDYLNVQRLEPKRRLTAYMNMREPVSALPKGRALLAAIDEAIARDEHLFEQERLWRARRDPRVEHREEARSLDRKLDGLLGAIHGALSAHVRLAEVEPERAAACEAALAEFFPEGLGALTQGSYHAQAHATRLLLRCYQESRGHQELAAILGFQKVFEELAELNAAYTAALNGHRPPSFDELELEREAGLERLGAIIARVLGMFPTDSADDRAGRDALLEPIERQHEIVSSIYRERRRGRSDDAPAGNAPAGEDPDAEAA